MQTRYMGKAGLSTFFSCPQFFPLTEAIKVRHEAIKVRHEAIKVRHYSDKTLKTYTTWVYKLRSYSQMRSKKSFCTR